MKIIKKQRKMIRITQFSIIKILLKMLEKRITDMKISESRERKKLLLRKIKNLNMPNIEFN